MGVDQMVHIVAITCFTIAWVLFLTYAGQLARNILLEMHKEYRSPEMGYAIEYLWRFYNAHQDNLVDAYLEAYETHKDNLEYMPPSQAARQALTPHQSRRQVSHFYQHLATLHNLRLLPTWMIKKELNKSDLDIVDKIIIPIEEGMLKDNTFGDTSDRKTSIDQLHSFYKHITSA